MPREPEANKWWLTVFLTNDLIVYVYNVLILLKVCNKDSFFYITFNPPLWRFSILMPGAAIIQ
jgi:hypothetical protein